MVVFKAKQYYAPNHLGIATAFLKNFGHMVGGFRSMNSFLGVQFLGIGGSADDASIGANMIGGAQPGALWHLHVFSHPLMMLGR